jgi:hypothetical protein
VLRDSLRGVPTVSRQPLDPALDTCVAPDLGGPSANHMPTGSGLTTITGYPPVAALRRRPGGYLNAWLYRLDRAVLKRAAAPAVWGALAAAMTARRTCPTCGRDTDCCIPRSLGQCWDCHLTAPTRLTPQPSMTPGDDQGRWAA